MRLCILGGTGFLGRHLCERVQARGMSGVSISRRPDLSFLARYAPNVAGFVLGTPDADDALRRCDVLVHLASSSLPGISWNDPLAELTRCTLLEVEFFQSFMRANPRCRIIYASSGGQFYGEGHRRPIDELAASVPKTAYALGKHVVEAALGLLSAAEGNPVTILRLANPIGRWQLVQKRGLVTNAVISGMSGKPLCLFGQGTNVRDYFDADDLADFIVGLALSPDGGVGAFNIGSDVGLTERDVVSLVGEVLRVKLDVTTEPARLFDLSYALLDSTRAREQLGWSPATPLEASVRKIRDAVILDGSKVTSAA